MDDAIKLLSRLAEDIGYTDSEIVFTYSHKGYGQTYPWINFMRDVNVEYHYSNKQIILIKDFI